MPTVEIYTKSLCPFCVRAKALLDRKQIPYTEFEISFDQELQQEMIQRSKRRTVPQIFIEGKHVGGSDDLVRLERSGELDELLNTLSVNTESAAA